MLTRVDRNLVRVQQRLARQLAPEIRAPCVDLKLDASGLVISLREDGAFDTGSAELSDVAVRSVTDVADALRDVDDFVRVEGHTDDVPISNAPFRSNWELSTTRATDVVALLTEGLASGQNAGYGEFRPREPNASPENRSRNRRVDLVVLHATVGRREDPRIIWSVP